MTETWEPANHLEEQLRDALRTGDQDAYFAALSGAELFVPLPQAEPGAPPPAFTWPTATRDGRTHVLAYTSPEAARICLGPGYEQLVRMPLTEIARTWPNGEWWLAVDSGLPVEGYLPAWFVGKLTTDPGQPADAAPHDRAAAPHHGAGRPYPGPAAPHDGGVPPAADPRQAGSLVPPPPAHPQGARPFGDGTPPSHGQVPPQDGMAAPQGVPGRGDVRPGMPPQGEGGSLPPQGEPPAPHGDGASFRPPAAPFPAQGDNPSIPPGEIRAFPPHGDGPRGDARPFPGERPFPAQGEPPAPHGDGASFRPPASPFPAQGDNPSIPPGEIRAFPHPGDASSGETGAFPPGPNTSVPPGEIRAFPHPGDASSGETGAFPPGPNTSVPPGEITAFPPHGETGAFPSEPNASVPPGEIRAFPPQGETPYGDAASLPGQGGPFSPSANGSAPSREPRALPPQGEAPAAHGDAASLPGETRAPYGDRPPGAEGEPPVFPVPGEPRPFPPPGRRRRHRGEALDVPSGGVPPVPPQDGAGAPYGDGQVPFAEKPQPRRGRRRRPSRDEGPAFAGEPPAFAPQGPTPPGDAFPSSPGEPSAPSADAPAPYGDAPAPYGDAPAPYGDAPAPYGEAPAPYGEAPGPHDGQPPFPGDAPPFPPPGDTPGVPPGGVSPLPPQGEPPAPPADRPYAEPPAAPHGDALPAVRDDVPRDGLPPYPSGLNGAVPPAPSGVPDVAQTRPQPAVSEFDATPPAPASHDAVPPLAAHGVPGPAPAPHDGTPAGEPSAPDAARPPVPPSAPGDGAAPAEPSAAPFAAETGTPQDGASGPGTPDPAPAHATETPYAAGTAPGESTPQGGPAAAPPSVLETDPPVALHFTPGADFAPLDDEERALYETAQHGDGAAFLRVLAGAQQIWVPMVEGTDLMLGPGRPGFRWYTREEDGRTVVPLFTGPSRMREVMGGHPFVLSDPAKVLRFWPDPSWDLVVNAGSPIGATIPGERMTELSRLVDAETAAVLARDFPAQNDAERQLFDARADTDLMVKVLLEASVFLPVWNRTPPGAQTMPGDPAFPWSAVPVHGRMAVPVFTSFDWMKEAVGTTAFVMPAFADLLAAWPEPDWSVSVNPGTPIEVTLTGEQIRGLGGAVADRAAGTLAPPAGVIAPPAGAIAPLDGPRPVEDVRPGPDGIADADAQRSGASVETPADVGEAAPAAEAAAESGAGDAEGAARIWTIMQKVVPHEQVPWYHEKAYDRVAGFVHRVRDVIGLSTPKQLYDTLGLLRHGSPFHPDDAEVHVIRWPAYLPELYRVPFGGTGEEALATWGDDGWVIEAPPFQGDGFAPGSGGSIPEYKVDSLRLPHGAEMYVIGGDGTERFIARYDADRLAWGEAK